VTGSLAPGAHTTSAVVTAERVSAAFGARRLWSDLTMSVHAGDYVAVLGGNGAGKTTLLRMLLGQLAPAAGTLTVLGGRPRRGHRSVGYVPQQRAFERSLALRGIDLVRLGLDGHRWGPGLPSRARDARVDAAIESVGAGGYATAAIGTLSGGEQQRLRVAQALVADPQLLLADEPLLSLDVASQHQITALLDERRRSAGTAVVMVTHDINPALEYVDRVLYLTSDRWAFGSRDDVLTTETLSSLYRSPVDVVRVRGRVAIVGTPDTGDHHHDEGGSHAR
jgi:zinc/manganese transport system ATP-binding protein